MQFLTNNFFTFAIYSISWVTATSASTSTKDSNTLSSSLNTTVTDHQVSIKIPTSFSPWKAVDVVQYNNNLNLEWESTSTFQNCIDDVCDSVSSNNFLDLGDGTDAAATYEITNPLKQSLTSINYISPILKTSTNGDYNVSFLVIIEYDDYTENLYAKVESSFDL